MPDTVLSRRSLQAASSLGNNQLTDSRRKPKDTSSESGAHQSERIRNPKRLGAQLGMLGILHTWSRTLYYQIIQPKGR